MDFKIIRGSEPEVQDFGNMKLKYLLDDEQWPFSINWIERTSDESKVGYEIDQDVAFYVLEGGGDVLVDEERYTLAEGDVIAFPRGTKWKFFKGMTSLAISSPRYDRTKRKYTE